jgi:basic membrane lipoprotein Med (substrate-binding protein (PBP1-ABC) superfamily)
MKRSRDVPGRSRGWRARRQLIIAVGVVAALGTVSVAAVGAGSATPTKQVKVALLLPGKKNDNGFSQLGYISLQNAKKQYPAIKIAVAENVPTATQNDVYRSFASQGYDLVVGWGGQYNGGAQAVAKSFPKTTFAPFFGFGAPTANFIPVNEREFQWSFVLGYAASTVSKTHHVGVVIGPCFPLSAEEAYGFRYGAQYANKSTKVDLVSLNSFDDPAAAHEATTAMIANGADGIAGQLNTGNRGIQTAAREHKGTLAFIENAVNFAHLEYPDVTLTSAGGVKYASIVTIPALVNELLAGTLTHKGILVPFPPYAKYKGIAPFPAGPAAIVKQRGFAPATVFKKLVTLQNQIAAGKVKVPDKTTCPLK